MLDVLRHDLRFALRQLRRSQGFAAVSVLTLALGIGATTAIFSMVHSVVIEPLDYTNPSRLVYIDQPALKSGPDSRWPVSEAAYLDYRAHVSALQGIGAYSKADFGVAGRAGAAQRVRGVKATASLLSVLGAKTMLGRLFGAEDDRPGAPPVALLSYAYWQATLGGDPSIVGRTLRIEGRPVPVIGVLAGGFRLPRYAADVWVPLQLDPSVAPTKKYHYLSVIGRLVPGLPLSNSSLSSSVV